MALVPMIGLSPFILNHLFRKNNIFNTFFFTGILVGFIPTILSLYYSYLEFGINSIHALFDFAKKQAIADFGLNNLLLSLTK